MASVTLNDVAAAAGVSRATVSLVVREDPRISDATRQRVLQAIVELGYIYNRTAANMRQRHSTTIGLIATDIRNPFFAELAMAVEETLDEAGYSLVQSYSRDDRSRQQRILRMMLEHRLGGLLILPAGKTTAEDLADTIGREKVANVLITRRVRGFHSDYVAIDNTRAATLVAEHLVSLDVKRVAFLGGVAGSTSRVEREQGLRAGLRKAGITLDKHNVVPSQNSRDGGRDAAAILLAQRAVGGPKGVDAVVCYSDYVATGVIAVLAERGLHIGTDVKVASFDDTSDARSAYPALTSVATYPALVGSCAAELLLHRMRNPEGAAQRIELAPTLVVRESTAPTAPGTRTAGAKRRQKG